jgi:hypothetical protein
MRRIQIKYIAFSYKYISLYAFTTYDSIKISLQYIATCTFSHPSYKTSRCVVIMPLPYNTTTDTVFVCVYSLLRIFFPLLWVVITATMSAYFSTLYKALKRKTHPFEILSSSFVSFTWRSNSYRLTPHS